MAGNPTDAERLGIPVRPFFWHLDQIETMLSMNNLDPIAFYLGRSVGAPPLDRLKITNLAPDGEEPIWRVAEKHFVQYLKFHNIRFYNQGYK